MTAPALAGRPGRAARRGWVVRWRGPVAGALAAALLVLAGFLFAHGVSANLLGPFISGGSMVTVYRYSGAWIAGAFGVALLALLLLVLVAADAYRALRRRRAVAASGGGREQWDRA